MSYERINPKELSRDLVSRESSRSKSAGIRVRGRPGGGGYEWLRGLRIPSAFMREASVEGARPRR